jgi:hypothetical protein
MVTRGGGFERERDWADMLLVVGAANSMDPAVPLALSSFLCPSFHPLFSSPP